MNIIEYCNLNKIKTLPINLEINDGKKTYLAGEKGRFKDGRYNFKMTDFDKLSLKQCIGFTQFYDDETNYIAIDTTTIHQLDIDDPAWWEDEARQDDDDTWYERPHFLSLTKGCPHYFYEVTFCCRENWCGHSVSVDLNS